jgi:hypothetical protein
MRMEIEDSLMREVEDISRVQGTSTEQMLQDLIRMGFDALLAGSTLARLETLERMLGSAIGRLDVMGPGVVGTQRLLTMWASRSDLSLGEEELQQELDSVGAVEWDLQLARRRLLSTDPLSSEHDQPEAQE